MKTKVWLTWLLALSLTVNGLFILIEWNDVATINQLTHQLGDCRINRMGGEEL